MRPSTVTAAVLTATVLLLVAVRDGHCAKLCMDSCMLSLRFLVIACLIFLCELQV